MKQHMTQLANRTEELEERLRRKETRQRDVAPLLVRALRRANLAPQPHRDALLLTPGCT